MIARSRLGACVCLLLAVLACLLVTVVSFFAVQPLIDLAANAAAALPF